MHILPIHTCSLVLRSVLVIICSGGKLRGERIFNFIILKTSTPFHLLGEVWGKDMNVFSSGETISSDFLFLLYTDKSVFAQTVV